ncbi:hypothetical protein KP509_07G059900 [Ceratopteris richardii]|nr:hypothetical protein KP509_07G059900 [Ceratopteris richardii]
MKHEGFHPNALTFLAILKAITFLGDGHQAAEVHSQVAGCGLLIRDITVGNALIDMYAKCGSFSKAHCVLDDLSTRNSVSWNALLTGHIKYGNGGVALTCFEHMQLEGISPDSTTFVCGLKACGLLQDVGAGQRLHTEIARQGPSKTDVEISNALIDMYSKCGELTMAQEVFDSLKVRNLVSWNSLMTCYIEQGHEEQALASYELMLCTGLVPNSVTFICVLKACSSVGIPYQGQMIHAHIVKTGLLESDCFIETALVDMYLKCLGIQAAEKIFNKLVFKTRASWNVLIAGYIECEENENGIKCFEQMQREGHSPDTVTFLSILKACGSLKNASKADQIHAEIAKTSLGTLDIVMVSNALVSTYVKCGVLEKAQEAFNKILVKTVISWNAIIAGYADQGLDNEVLKCFECMQASGVCPDEVTFVYILKACGSIKALEKGEELHDLIIREGMLENDSFVATALVNMYFDLGMLVEAQIVHGMSVRDEVSWNVLISGFIYHRLDDMALQSYKQMLQEGFAPNVVTFLRVLKACAGEGTVHKGQELHSEIARIGHLQNDVMIGAALIDMYASFGMLRNAQDVFDKLTIQDKVSCSAMISAHLQFGDDESVMNLIMKAFVDEEELDPVTSSMILNSCAHAGLVDAGQLYFQTMATEYLGVPTLEHHICMVDLFGRAGALDRVFAVIEDMPFSSNCIVWHNVLGACQKHDSLESGRIAFNHAIELAAQDVVALISIRNIYAAANMQDNVKKLEAFRTRNVEVDETE